MALGRAVLVAVVAMMAAGCFGDRNEGYVPPGMEGPHYVVEVAGLHFAWTSPTSIDVEGYLVNPTNEPQDVTGYAVGMELQGTEGRVTQDEVWPPGSNWTPGEVRTVRARFTEVIPDNYTIMMFADLPDFLMYASACRDPSGRLASGCSNSSAIATRTPTSEEAQWPRYLNCCDWIPPGHDIHSLECARTQFLTCSAVVVNWRGDKDDVRLTAYVEATSVDGTRVPGPEFDVELGDSLEEGEQRAVRFDVPPDAIPAGIQPRVTLTVASARIPASAAEETTDPFRIPIRAQDAGGVASGEALT